jgi:hypothetical protein
VVRIEVSNLIQGDGSIESARFRPISFATTRVSVVVVASAVIVQGLGQRTIVKPVRGTL